MRRYPNIGDHGLIGGLQTAALVNAAITLNRELDQRANRAEPALAAAK
jgi:hypothetical protein